MKTINYPKYRKPIVIVTLLHLLLMLSFFFIGINVLWYNFLFFGFFMFCSIEMVRYYTMDKMSRNILIMGILLYLVVNFLYVYVPTLKNVYFSYISAVLFLFIIAFSIFKTVQKKSDNRKADYFIFGLLLAAFVFTIFMNIYQMNLRINLFKDNLLQVMSL